MVQVNQQFRCGGSADKAEAENSNILAGFWQATVCEGTQDNPKGNSAGCRLTSSFAPTAAPGNGDPETLRPQRTFVEVRLTSGLLDTCFATLQVQSRSSGESVTSAASDISEAAFPGCSLEWEKRDDQGVLQGGATFEVLGDAGNADPGGLGTEDGIFACLTTVDVNPVTVVDNVGAMGTFLDQDPDPGQFQLVGICEGTYTITETIAPSGFAIDTDFDRVVVIGTGAQNVVVGAQDTDDVSTDIATLCGQGQTDECDFHNRLGTLEWEKRDDQNVLQGGAQFSISPNPFACYNGADPGTFTDNSAPDDDSDDGQIKINRVCLASYTITETTAPSGWAKDTDTTRLEPVSVANLNAVVGSSLAGDTDDPGITDESDFHNRLGTLEWEKRDDQNLLQGGAQFSISPNPFVCYSGADPGTFTDNSAPDEDSDDGQIKINRVCLDDYTITEEVAPSGWAKDTDTIRLETVSEANLNAVVGTLGQGQNDAGTTDESDFHNRLGTLEWEKRDASQTNHPLQGDATFTVLGAATNNPSNVQDGPFACHDTDSDSGDEDNPVTVTDNDALDQDPTAGQIKLSRVCLGDYTITETAAPSGYAVDDDPNREISVTGGALNPTVGTDFSATDTGVDDDSRSPHATGDCGAEDCDFHNRRGTLVIRKEGKDASRTVTDDLLGGATFTITPNPFTGSSTGLDVTDDQNSGGVVDQYLTDGMICLDGVQLDSYAIVEKTAPPNYSKDTRTENVTVSTSSSCAARLAAATAQLEQNVDEDALFDNIPLSQIEIIFTSLAGVGITQLEIPIVCATPTAAGVDVLDTDADPENDDAVLDRAEVFTDLLPGTYVCTIVIDP